MSASEKRTAIVNPTVAEPAFGDELAITHPSSDTLDLLRQRRSTVAKNMRDPGPTEDELRILLSAGIRVPDHGKLAPWRFLIFRGDKRGVFGQKLEAIFLHDNPNASAVRSVMERNRFNRAPVVVAVISSITPDHKIPVWEQELSVGAVCQNILIACNAMGFAAQWLTEWYAYDQRVNALLGLSETERVAGFIYMGSADAKPIERKRPNLEALMQDWSET